MSVAEGWPEPPYVIRTDRLTLRCYERTDVRRMHPIVLANLDALRRWMPWVRHEPLSLEERGAQLRAFRARFDAGQDFIYGVFDRPGGAYVGGCGLHPRPGPRHLELGYWLIEDRWGRGLGTEIASALTRVGFEHMRAERMEIRVVPTNVRSVVIPRRLGFAEEGTMRRVLPTAVSSRRDDLIVFGMLAEEHASNPASKVWMETEGFIG